MCLAKTPSGSEINSLHNFSTRQFAMTVPYVPLSLPLVGSNPQAFSIPARLANGEPRTSSTAQCIQASIPAAQTGRLLQLLARLRPNRNALRRQRMRLPVSSRSRRLPTPCARIAALRSSRRITGVWIGNTWNARSAENSSFQPKARGSSCLAVSVSAGELNRSPAVPFHSRCGCV